MSRYSNLETGLNQSCLFGFQLCDDFAACASKPVPAADYATEMCQAYQVRTVLPKEACYLLQNTPS